MASLKCLWFDLIFLQMSTWGPRAGTSHGGLEPPWGSCCLDFEGKEPTVTASSSCHRLLWGVLVLPWSQEAERKEPLLPWQPAPSTGKLLPVLVEAPPGLHWFCCWAWMGFLGPATVICWERKPGLVAQQSGIWVGIMMNPFAALNQRLLTGPANLFTSLLGRLWS